MHFYHTKVILIVVIFFLCSSVNSSARHLRKKRLVNGLIANKGQFPWHAKLSITRDTNVYNCGGAIIDPEWIITSARCVKGASQIDISVGSVLLGGIDVSRVNRVGKTINVHENFQDRSFRNDIGLVKLNESLPFNDYIKPIGIANEGLLSGRLVEVSSFGSQGNSVAPRNDLIYLALEVTSNHDCNTFNSFNITSDGILCADTKNKIAKLCHGDDGAPLVDNSVTPPVLVGLAIVGKDPLTYNCNSDGPALFTNLAAFQGWIGANKHEKNGAIGGYGISWMVLSLSALFYIVMC